MPIATGQFTIIDYNDALTLTGFIGSNHTRTQIFNPDNGQYNPNWATTNLVLTPSLFKLGSTADVIAATEVTNVKWFEAGSGTAIVANATYGLSGTKSHILTVKTNVLATKVAQDWICEITYRDATTNMDLITKLSITFNKAVNGGGITDAIAWAPSGNVFKNETINTLTAQCELWRGSTVDNTSVTYKWALQDPAVTTTGHANYDAEFGLGWRRITADITNMVTGTATNTITIFDAYVTNVATFRCSIKDTDSGSSTFNQTFTDSVTFIDNSDPFQITVLSSGGDVFKNGVGSTVLTAKVYQAGNEVDAAGTKYSYKWYKFDKNGTIDANFGGAGINFKSGKTLAVGDADVDVKGTFQIEVN